MEGLSAGHELPFAVSFSGHSGHLRLQPLHPSERRNAVSNLPDLILPPAYEPETPETIIKKLEDEYLTPALDNKEFDPDVCGKQWEFDWFNKAVLHLQPSQPRLSVVPVWEAPYKRKSKQTSTDTKETSSLWIPESLEIALIDTEENAKDSSSLLRRPGPPEDFISGSTNNRPFKPGGFEDSQTLGRRLSEDRVNGDWVNELVCSGSLQTVPPGFKHGMDFGFSKAFIDKNRISNTDSELNIESSAAVKSDQLSVQYDDLFKKAWEENILEKETDDESSDEEEPSVSNNQDEEVDSLSKNQSGIYAENQFGNQDVQITNKTTSFNSETQDATKPEANILDEILKASEVNTSQREAKPDAESKEIWAVIVEGEEISKNFTELVPDLALAFPFELDKFQKEAIYHIERGDSVFVAAHTSAGKTVVAEYAFALAAKHCTRAVYTSPIKTISNQKYRDFSEKFDVGLLTGDVSLRPEASCLIMTTEILRSMLYKGADIIRDIEWVIFDEVHYVNDIERGVVWEEVIIMLPKHINFVLLSATVPNKLEFADWIGRTKRKKIYVTGTTQRPVPLEHHLYYSGDLYKICERENFLPSGVKFAKDAYNKKNKIKQAPTRTAAPNSQGNDKWGGHQQQRMPGNLGHGTSRNPNSVPWKTETSQLNMMMKMLSKKGWLPIVVFCFSKNRCDQAADSLTALDLTSGSEKSEIHVFCEKAFSRLKGSDRHLPQVVRVQNLLRRGIGVHHAGLLPIVKEVVEMLFCRGVIKVLFSTETFAMGVNAPAKTVAFHSVRKFDGKSFRQLLPGEYTQMAGRAGRRGLDEVGIVVIICWDEIPDESDLKNIIIGKPTKLESQFRLTYTMILNLLRVEDLKIEDMLKRSFAEFHAQRALPEQQKQLLKGEGELSKMNSLIDCIRGEPKIDEYHDTAIEVDKLNAEIHEAVMQSRAVKLAITAGRVIIVRTHLVRVHSLGVVLKPPSATNKNPIVLVLIQDPSFSIPEMEISNKISQTGDNKFSEGYYRKGNKNIEDDYSLFGNLPRKPSGVVNLSLPHYGKTPDSAYVVTEVENKDFVSLCKNKIQVDIYRLLEDVNTSAYTMTVQQLLQILRQQPNQYPAGLDPVKDLKLSDVDTVQGYQKLQKLLQKMSQNYCHGCPKLFENYKLVQDRQTLMEKVKKLRYEMSDAALQQMPDFQQRIEVLQEVGCIDLDLVVQLKGRVACEINSGDELIATEMLFENQLDDLEPAEAVAIMSSLIFQQKETSNTHLTPQLDMAKKRLFQTAMRLGELQARYGLPLNPKDYANDSLKFGLVEVVYEWAKGTPFADICQLTDVPEGAIVRTIVRLDETCREFKNAARIMGNSALYEKMDIGSNAIKRDIVFAASLYVTGVPS